MTAKYTPVRHLNMWKIEKSIEGPMPKALSGLFTEEYKAKTVIDLFLADVERKVMAGMSPAQRKRAEADKAKVIG